MDRFFSGARAPGAVGKPLCDELRARGHKVVSADVRHSGDDDAIRCDVSHFRQLERIFDQHRLRLVYHAAGEFGRWNGEAYYENMWLTNAVGTKNVLELARRYDCRVVEFSSSEVYGDFDGVMNEDVPDRFPLRQMNDYAISKWANELQAINAGLMHGTKVVRVRLFNTYGPGEYYHPYRSVICKFIYSALKGLPYTVYTQHHRGKSYIFDVVKQLAAFVEQFDPGQAYNIGSAEYFDMRTVSDMVLAATAESRPHGYRGPRAFHDAR